MLAPITWLGVLLLAGQPGVDVPVTPVQPDELTARGLELRRQGKDRDALPLFQRVLEQTRTPKAAAQEGLCEQALGLWLPAEAHLRDALAHPGDPWIERNAAALQGSLQAVHAHLGTIEIWGTPAGARVSVDGQSRGTLPVARGTVPEGRRVVSVDARGFVAEERAVEVVAGTLVREHVALVPWSAGQPPGVAAGSVAIAAPSPAVIPPSGPAAAGVNLRSSASPPPAAPPDGILRRWWFWAVLGGVAVAGGVSAYLLFRTGDKCQAPAGGVCGNF